MRIAAFLRGLNVGGHRIKMDHLKALFTELRLNNPATFIASGNVVFDDSGVELSQEEARISDHLLKDLGYEVATFLRRMNTLPALIELGRKEAGNDAATKAYAFFLHEDLPREATAKLSALETSTDQFPTHGCEFFWIRGSDSSMDFSEVPKVLKGIPHTARNLNTLERMVKKFGA